VNFIESGYISYRTKIESGARGLLLIQNQKQQADSRRSALLRVLYMGAFLLFSSLLNKPLKKKKKERKKEKSYSRTR
jgi:hypothetical protein